jgi:hypothetical protein
MSEDLAHRIKHADDFLKKVMEEVEKANAAAAATAAAHASAEKAKVAVQKAQQELKTLED